MLGLNFYPPSPRAVDTEGARAIATAVRAANPTVRLVGVFVNRPRFEIEAIDAHVGLDLLQFHGDEEVVDLAPFADRAIKVIRVRDTVRPSLFAPYRKAWGFLIDYQHPSLYGGSGQGWRFETLRSVSRERPVMIAGGLTPHNVANAVATAAPWGVDVCSGVESAPGRKNTELLRQLFQEIHHGQGAIAS